MRRSVPNDENFRVVTDLKLCKEAEVLCALTRKWSTKVGFKTFPNNLSKERTQIQKSYLRGVHNGPRGSIDPIWSSRRSRSGSTMEADWCPPGVSRASIGASSVVRVRLRWVRSVQISGPMLLRLKRGEDSRVHGILINSRHSLKFLESVSRSSVPRSGSTKSWWHW